MAASARGDPSRQANRLVIVVPGLLRAEVQPVSSPSLAWLIDAAGGPSFDNDGTDGALAALYGVVRQHDWPLASVFLAQAGVDQDTDYWLIADPVTFVAGHNQVHLAGVLDDLHPDDARRFASTLNAHFASDGLLFVVAGAHRFFVRCATPPMLVTRPVACAVGQPLRGLLPSGEDAPRWRRWQDEIQMLLHEHPVNIERDRRGQVPMNGIWFWGGGTRAQVNATPTRTWASGGTAAALAAYVGSPAKPLPERFDDALSAPIAGTNVVYLDRRLDSDAIERDWMAPAWKALRRGSVPVVTVITDGDGRATVWHAQRPGVWQRIASRWRTPGLPTLLDPGRTA